MEYKKKLIYVIKMFICWGDMDVYGYVNNMVYFCYMEQVCVEWIEVMYVFVCFGGVGLVIINVSCIFLILMNYLGIVEVCIFVGLFGCFSVQIYVEMIIDGDECFYVEGVVKVVWMDMQIGKLVLLLDHVWVMFEVE